MRVLAVLAQTCGLEIRSRGATHTGSIHQSINPSIHRSIVGLARSPANPDPEQKSRLDDYSQGFFKSDESSLY
jgi:hypothetical protein